MEPVTLVVIAVVAVIVLWTIASYNRLVRLRNEAEEGFSSIDVQLQRRADLIPNLVSTVKGYAAHESETFSAVTEARARVQGAQGVAATAAADDMLTGALGRLMAVAEAYPELQASENFQELQEELSDTEDKISAARRYYNSVVRRYNTALQQLPTNIVANIFGFDEREYYRIAEEGDREVPQVAF